MSNIGLHIDGSAMHLALLKKRKGKVEIQSLKHTDTLISEPFLEKRIEMTTGLSCRDTLVRTIDIPLTKRKGVLEALPFQIEHQVPYPLNDLIINTSLHPIDKTSTKAQIIASPKSKIAAHLKLLQDRGLSANWISSHAQALYRYCSHFYPNISNCIALFFGSKETSLISIIDHKLHTSTSIAIGYSHFIDLWNSENPGKKFPALHAEIFTDAKSEVHKLKKRYFSELDRCIHFVKGRCKTALHMNALPLGYFIDFFGADPIIENPIQERCEIDKAPFAIGIGLALDTLCQDQQTIQFRQNNFTPSAHLAKLGKKLCYCFFLASLLAFFSLFLTNGLLHRREINLERKMNAFIDGWEQVGKLSRSKFALSHEKKPLRRIEYKLDRLKNILRTQKGFFPVYSQVPLVSETLATLTQVPLFERVNIQSFNYQLLQYPLLSKPFSSYDGIVQLYMKIPEPSLARQIQDYLQNDCALVDKSKDLRWERSSDGYTAEFHLRSRLK
ncbi:MAG TPA: hypothetical protein PLO43_02275 [Chlamydiales bacterium]|nr:hypothetical protein [Chlamydiales bacterium]